MYLEDRLTAMEEKIDRILSHLTADKKPVAKTAEKPAKKPEPAAEPTPVPAKGPDIEADRDALRKELLAAKDRGVSPKKLLEKLGFKALSDAKTKEDLDKIMEALGMEALGEALGNEEPF